MKISILIPVYNEFLTLPLVLERVRNAPLPAGCSKEIVIVDDGSTDGTTEALRKYQNDSQIQVHHSEVNAGKGAALRVAIAKATGDVLLVQDGDLEYDPRDYTAILDPIVRGEAKIVYGSRFLRPGSGAGREMRWAHWIANKSLTLTANILYSAGITDEATAYKAFRRDVLESMELVCSRFEFCPEVTAKSRRLGHRIHEVPVSYNPRGVVDGKKIRASDGIEALWTLVRYRFYSIDRFRRQHSVPKTRAVSAP